jgi:hypothetical protein
VRDAFWKPKTYQPSGSDAPEPLLKAQHPHKPINSYRCLREIIDGSVAQTNIMRLSPNQLTQVLKE